MPLFRPMLIFVSDIHLTDSLHGPVVPKDEVLRRFWVRIQAARGPRPARLVFVGDLFDIVRSPRWLETSHRPYHPPGGPVVAVVGEIVEAIIQREAAFFDELRQHVAAGELEVDYILGNHDRLLAHAPKARRAIWRAMTGRESTPEFPNEGIYPEHGVLAYHGHVADPICAPRATDPPIGDAIGLELIVRFPMLVREVSGLAVPELDDVDDVRPIYAVPAWIRQMAALNRELLRPIGRVWSQLVEEFLSNTFVRSWMRHQPRGLGFPAGRSVRLLLELSTGRIMKRAHDQRLTRLYQVLQHGFDGKLVGEAVAKISTRGYRGLRYIVNGHSHFPTMVPLGRIDGEISAYFNTGTWRTVHQIAHKLGGRPTFLPYDAMTYLVFFPDGDPMGREYEWWTGAMVPRTASEA